ncbi:DUF6387 family protein [Uliginosibacterium sp. sgz301328]|uniref:DUF6387 family protein n=1 Tax=Uliginosibacterium sp. sgz301328 TaxID=3243764 RepID=UPI00359DED89
MRAKIRLDEQRLLSIPPIFDISKYDACKRWGVLEWHRAIEYRVFLSADWKKSTKREFDIEDVENIYVNYKGHVENLIKKPFCKYTVHSVGTKRLVRDYTVADLFESLDDERITSSSWVDKFNSWNAMDYFTRYEIEGSRELVNLIEKMPTWKMMQDVYGPTRSATITINMSGDDEAIKKEFSAWLKTTREEMNLKKPLGGINEFTFSDWHNDRVLPCFDLLLYQEIHNGHFKLSELNDALFPNDKWPNKSWHDENRLRRTVMPNALKVVSATTASALEKELNTCSSNKLQE